MSARIVASFFSGVEANHVAIERAGVPWRTDTVSEIETFPCAVLAARCPDAVNLGDFTKLNPADMYAAEIAVGGPPCQSFSIAGGRKGLDDDRGNLTLKYVDLCHDLNTNGSLRVAFYENVPGILSDKTNAFGCLISGLVGGVDAVLPPDAEWKGLLGNIAPSRHKGKTSPNNALKSLATNGYIDGTTSFWELLRSYWSRDRGERVRRLGNSEPFGSHWDGTEVHPSLNQSHNTGGIGASNQEVFSQRGAGLVPGVHCFSRQRTDQYSSEDIASTVAARDYKDATDLIAFSAKDYGGDAATELSPTLRAGGHDKSHANSGNWMAVAFNARQDPDCTGDISGCVNAGSPQDQAVAFDMRGREGGAQMKGPHDTANIRAASGGSSKSYIATQYAVRRLMPVETERLQGFPDGWTKIPYRNKPADKCPDGPRYKAMGNSWAVNVIAWIYTRIEAEMSRADTRLHPLQ